MTVAMVSEAQDVGGVRLSTHPLVLPANPIPDSIRARLSADEIAQLQALMVPRLTQHAIDYRASTSLFGRGFYLVFAAGAERRPLRRLRQEGLTRSFFAVFTELAVASLMISLLVGLLVGLVVGGIFTFHAYATW
jgi:hypothetical protein